MRRVKKIQKYSNIRELSPYIPARISKFQRPKWKFFQKKIRICTKSTRIFCKSYSKKGIQQILGEVYRLLQR